MSDFFPIETPYSSEDYKIMKDVVNQGIDSHLEGFTKSEFKKSPNWSNKFLWNIHDSELPILYRRLEKLYDDTGNDDYISFLDDVRKVADTTKAAIAAGGEYEENLDEMIDPYDPMDTNQTANGEPAGNSDLGPNGVDTAPAYSNKPAMVNRGIENYIDDDSIGQELAAENTSDSLANKHGENLKAEGLGTLGLSYTNEGKAAVNDFIADYDFLNKNVTITNDQDENGNFGETGEVVSIIEPTERQRNTGYRLINYIIQFPESDRALAYLRSEFEHAKSMDENSSDSLANLHGMNAKPNTIDEITDTERYEDVVFMQGDEADEPLEILKNKGPEAAMKYLEQWHQPGQHMGRTELGLGNSDKTFKKDGYILSWNPYIGYIGLTYDTEHGLDEDSQMMRHRAGQRGKIGNTPLGQHAPHSQAAIKENKNK